MMTKRFSLIALLILSFLLLVACDSNTTLPTLRPTLDSSAPEPTVDPNLGSGFDPDLGNDNNDDATPLPTPTRESGVVVSGDTESGARGTGFVAQITGSSVTNINDGGQYACNVAGHRITSGANPAPNVTFIVPNLNVVGAHMFIGADDAGDVAVQVALASLDDSYNQVIEGTLTIDEVPQASGEFVSGSFDFVVSNGSGNEVGIRGEFDFESGDTAYCS